MWFVGRITSSNKSWDVAYKLSMFNNLCGTKEQTLIKFYKVLAVPSNCHGGECWTVTHWELKIIESADAVLGTRYILFLNRQE
jgi:hypothetical protein